ncbi:MAG TPA: 2Fe-2S iron-sulfur cluster-binding protein, partial [Vitreimonas sp.]|nr:2Fe-2S iron-sulfur cluster-binding protein [Vitreimonas sp.]
MADRRLPVLQTEELRRGKPLSFTFDGRKIAAFEGDTVGSALSAAGIDVLSRSFKYHRPRGLLCNAGRCPNCLVEADGLPNARACTTAVADGMRVRSQNAWPSLRRDLLSMVDRFDRFFPIGFYYKTFIRPRRLWPLYEKVLRSAAGIGRIDPKGRPDLHARKRHLHADVAVVGGGPAGCLAALEAAAAGARVVLVDDGTKLGGHLRIRSRSVTGDARIDGLPGWQAAARLAELVAAEPGIEHLAQATAIGLYEDGLLGVMQGNTFIRLRAGRIVVATGAAERPALFDGNDRPGIMLASGALRLTRLQAVKPGERAVVVTDDDHGWRQAAELVDAGITVVALVDSRPDGVVAPADREPLAQAGMEVLPGTVPVATTGANRVTALSVRTADGDRRSIDCDLVVVATRPEPVLALLGHEGITPRYDERLGEWVPGGSSERVLAAGHVTGLPNDELALRGGLLAGRRAAADAGFGPTNG